MEQTSIQWKKIAGYYRERIASGELAIGDRLPTTREMAEQFSASVFCVQYAISALAHEGLVTRRPRYGTTVAERLPELRLAAVVVFSDRKAGVKEYIQQLAMRVSVRLSAIGCETVTLWEDMGDPEVIARLRRSIKALGIQAIIHFSTSPQLAAMLKSLHVPVVTGDRAAVGAWQIARLNGHVEAGCRAIAESGCRRPALLSAMYLGRVNPENERYLADLAAATAKYRIDLPPERIVTPPDFRGYSAAEQTAFARDAVRALWAAPQRPDLLWVYPDNFIPGVVLAAAELGIRIPDELRLVLYRNRQIDYFVPFPYTGVELDIDRVAGIHVAKLCAVFGGRKIDLPPPEYDIVEHSNMEEQK